MYKVIADGKDYDLCYDDLEQATNAAYVMYCTANVSHVEIRKDGILIWATY